MSEFRAHLTRGAVGAACLTSGALVRVEGDESRGVALVVLGCALLLLSVSAGFAGAGANDWIRVSANALLVGGSFACERLLADSMPGVGWVGALGALGVVLEREAGAESRTTATLAAANAALGVVGAALGSEWLDAVDSGVAAGARVQQAALGLALALWVLETPAGLLAKALGAQDVPPRGVHLPVVAGSDDTHVVASTSELLMPSWRARSRRPSATAQRLASVPPSGADSRSARPSSSAPGGVEWVTLRVSSQGVVLNVDGDSGLVPDEAIGTNLEELLGGAVAAEELESLRHSHELPRLLTIRDARGEPAKVEMTLRYIEGGSAKKLSDVRVALRRVSWYQRAVEARGRQALVRFMSPALERVIEQIMERAEAAWDLSTESLEELAALTASAREVLNDVSTFVDMEMGELPGRARTPFTVAGLARKVRDAGRSLCAEGVTVDMDLGRIRHVKKGNAHCVHLVLSHLVTNACKFTRQGRIVIRAQEEVDEELARDGFVMVRFEVVDSGCGVDAALKHVLLDSFPPEKAALARPFNLSGATLGEHEPAVDASALAALAQAEGNELAGAGLGLGACSIITHMLGGTLDVVPNHGPGGGTTASFTVQLEQGEVSEDATPMPTPAGGRRRLEPKSVLVVDDARVNRKVAERLLVSAGYDVVLSEDGQDAIRVYKARLAEGKTFNAILMDVEMPVMNGWKATEALRGMGCLVPVIALTGYTSNQYKVTSMWSGMDAFVAKPFRKPNLLDTVARFINQQHRSSAGGQQPFVPFRAVDADTSASASASS